MASSAKSTLAFFPTAATAPAQMAGISSIKTLFHLELSQPIISFVQLADSTLAALAEDVKMLKAVMIVE
jgi:hypothetical protein